MEEAAEELFAESVATASRKVRRPWMTFFFIVFSVVIFFTLPIGVALRAWLNAMTRTKTSAAAAGHATAERAAAERTLTRVPTVRKGVSTASLAVLGFSPCELGLAPCISPPPPKPPPRPPSPQPPSPPPPSTAYVPDTRLVHFMVTLGFSKEQAASAVAAVKAKTEAEVYSLAQPWLLAQNKEKNLAEARAERDVRTFDAMDMDGYALRWGSDHIRPSLHDCGRACLEFVPVPPYHMPCNIFVYCPKDHCFAPAQLPPGNRSGWCWLKHQDDPNNPHVNMRGTDNRGKPVDWQAGVVVRKGTQVQTGTKSARAHW